MLPLAITAFSVVCATGYGYRALLAALRERHRPLRPQRFHRPAAADLDRARAGSGVGRLGPARGAATLDVPQQPAGLGGAQHRWVRGCRGCCDRALRRRTHRAGDGALPLQRSMRPRRSIAIWTIRQACRRTCCSRSCTRRIPIGDFVQRALGLAGPCFTIATACSSSAKVFCQPSGCCAWGCAMPSWSAAWTHSATVCCTASGPSSCCRRIPAGPSVWIAADLNIGEAAAFVLLERGDRSDLALLGYGETSDAHHMSAPHPAGTGARLAVEQALARAGLEPGRHPVHQSARHGDPQERRGRSAGRGRPVSRHDARQFDQGLDRTHAGRRGQPGGGDHVPGAAHGPGSGHAQHHAAGCRVRAADPARQQRCGHSPGFEQFVRFRRQQTVCCCSAGMRHERGARSRGRRVRRLESAAVCEAAARHPAAQ